MADSEYKPEEEGSLDEFEKDVIAKEKKKSQRNVAISAVLLVVLAGAGYYFYSTMFGAPEAPPPPVVAPAMTPAPEAAAPAATPAAPAAAPVAPVKKVEAKKEEPAKKTAATEAKAAPGKTETAKPAPAAPGAYTLQLGVFVEKANAEALIKQAEKLGFTPETLEKPVNVKSIGIYTGYYRYRELAAEGSAKLSKDGFANRIVLKGPGNYTVEVGTYKTDKEADVVVKKLNANGYKVDVDYTTVKKPASVVLLRNIESADRVKEITDTLKGNKIDYVVLRKK
ncbi:MAG: SPOR domain-containing protein [Nitrospinae bacterium]|nr:SPOR domain-containing protein [Nitrospinota bacterium]